MRCLVLGAGALGSILAAHLARAGHEVTLIARGARAAALHTQPVRITGLVDFAIHCAVCAADAVPTNTDVFINTVKTRDSRTALAGLGPCAPAVAFSVQNGVVKEEELAARFGAAQVLGAMADFSGELGADGSVEFSRNVCLHLGEPAGGRSARATEVAAAIDAAGIVCRPSPAIATVIWSKYVGWNALMLAAVLTRRTTDDFLRDPDSALIVARITREMGALAAARGIPLRDQSPLPVASIVQATEADAVRLVQDTGETFARVARGHRMSSLQDVTRGTPLELEETVGHALAAARELALDMPVTTLCYRLVASIDRGLCAAHA